MIRAILKYIGSRRTGALRQIADIRAEWIGKDGIGLGSSGRLGSQGSLQIRFSLCTCRWRTGGGLTIMRAHKPEADRTTENQYQQNRHQHHLLEYIRSRFHRSGRLYGRWYG